MEVRPMPPRLRRRVWGRRDRGPWNPLCASPRRAGRRCAL